MSFSFEIITCNQNYKAFTSVCKSPEEIDEVLDKIYFTMYTLQESPQLAAKGNLNKRPTIVRDLFHS